MSDLLQLINDLGAADARLAPQLRLLLARHQKEKPARKPTSGKDTEQTKVGTVTGTVSRSRVTTQ